MCSKTACSEQGQSGLNANAASRSEAKCKNWVVAARLWLSGKDTSTHLVECLAYS